MSNQNRKITYPKAGDQMVTSDEFNKLRSGILEEFYSESIFRKQKLSQAAFWFELDKDLANQYFRDERWFFGIKYLDEIKFIDHSVSTESTQTKTSIGFGKTK